MKARINPDTQTWEYGPNEMPDRKGWMPFVQTHKPTVTAQQVAYLVAPVVTSGTAVETWVVRDKTPDELAVDADAAELEQIKAAYLALKNGTGTSAERLARAERVLARVLKHLWGN